MKAYFSFVLIAALLAPALAEAGPIRNVLGRGKSAAGKVLKVRPLKAVCGRNGCG